MISEHTRNGSTFIGRLDEVMKAIEIPTLFGDGIGGGKEKGYPPTKLFIKSPTLDH